MKIHGKSRTSIWVNDAVGSTAVAANTTNAANTTPHSVHIIDQTLLPFALEEHEMVSLEQTVEAIRSMRVRGAPLIGITAAYGIALAMNMDSTDTALQNACRALAATRPTAVNLAWSLERMKRVLTPLDELDRTDAAWREAGLMAREDIDTNAAIGRHGLELIRALYAKHHRVINVLTHCNAGALACVDWGTATAPIYMAHNAGIPVHVWVDETRPRNQGLLTAWELRERGVPHTYIVDNAGGHLLQYGKVDIVLVGVDRVSCHGDIANKIGTYQKALAAHDNKVPFYAATPSSSIDWQLDNAHQEIEIEERHADEIRHLRGQSADGIIRDFRILDEASAVANPGFDITPSRLISGIITERGIATPNNLAAMFPVESAGKKI